MEAKDVDPLALDDVPGLGPVGIKALNEEGFYTTLQLICKNPTFLKDVTGMERDKAGDAFQYMKKKLEVAGLIGRQEMSATDLLKIRKKVDRISVGCKGIDSLLNGGVECKAITEFYGHEGSGKTQIGHTLAIQVQRLLSEGGLADVKKPAFALYIDTENTCRPERFISILAGKNLITQIPKKILEKISQGKELTKEEQEEHDKLSKQQEKEGQKYLDRIIVWKASNAYQQILYIKNAMSVVKEMNIKLIIVDSGTALFRSDYLGRGNTKAKFDLMNEMIHDLKMIAENFNIAIVFVNQIYNKPDEMYGQDPDIPYGGHIIGHAIPYRMKLFKSGKKHAMRIMKSPYQSNDDVKFLITAEGISDAE